MIESTTSAPAAPRRPRGRIAAAFARASAELGGAARFACWYGPAVGGSVALHLWWMSHGLGAKAIKVLLIFTSGAAIGGFLAWLLAAMLVGASLSFGRRAAVMLILLIIGTAGTTSLIYFVDFRSYFAQFHDSTFSRDWLIEMLFTGAGALYVFASVGLRLMLPVGLAVLFIGAFAFAGHRRRAG